MAQQVKAIVEEPKPAKSLIRKVKPSVLADQLCLWDQELFKRISSIEFLNQIWKDPAEQEIHSPNLSTFIKRFEMVCQVFSNQGTLSPPPKIGTNYCFRKVIGLPAKYAQQQI